MRSTPVAGRDAFFAFAAIWSRVRLLLFREFTDFKSKLSVLYLFKFLIAELGADFFLSPNLVICLFSSFVWYSVKVMLVTSEPITEVGAAFGIKSVNYWCVEANVLIFIYDYVLAIWMNFAFNISLLPILGTLYLAAVLGLYLIIYDFASSSFCSSWMFWIFLRFTLFARCFTGGFGFSVNSLGISHGFSNSVYYWTSYWVYCICYNRFLSFIVFKS